MSPGSDLVGPYGEFVFSDDGELASTRLESLAPGRRLNASALAAEVLFGAPSEPDATLYEGVRARWCEPSPPPQEIAAPSSATDAVVVLRSSLDAALDRALSGARRVGVLTGGGVDSSVLLAVAHERAKRVGATVFAVSLDFAGPGDDRPHLRAMEAKLGCEVLRVAPEDAVRRMPLFWTGVDAAPFGWPTAPFEVEMMARARENGADRVLTGAGGDELFDGDPLSLAHGGWLRNLASARRMTGFDRPRWPVYSWVLRPRLVERVPERVRVWRRRRHLEQPPTWAGPVLANELAREAERDAVRPSARATPASRFDELATRPHRLRLAWLRHQEATAAAIERIDPYMDLGLVRAVTALRPELLLAGARRRGLLREAVRGSIPESVRLRMDKAYFEAAFVRLTAAMGGLATFAPLASGERLAELGIVDRGAFATAARAFLDDPKGEEWLTIWPALACEAFLRERGEVGT